jgi:phosphoribosylformylglycinamidine cyclo-ligase
MSADGGLTYRDAGVDLDAAADVKARIRDMVESTRTEAVRAGYGSFGGRFHAGADAELVASADGVGTKLKVAFRAGRHDTVGRDLVNHCVNDILTEGAVPLVFMDYFACGRLNRGITLDVVRGVAEACRENGCALLGGETAEMPDFYPAGEYDLAGFVVGRLEWPAVARREVRAGDVLLGLASSGLHTNGFSFVRKLLFDRLELDVEDRFPGTDATIGDVLLRPHRSYLRALQGPCGDGLIRALAHVTGGGIPGNLNRVLPSDLDAVVDLESWTPAPEFRFLQQESSAPATEMYRTFNMGVGMVAVVRPEDEASVVSRLERSGCPVWRCGEVTSGTGAVRLQGLDRAG